MNYLDREIKIQCYAMALSAEEIKSNIPINTMAEIKDNNPHPYFRAYSIMQDGVAKPRVIGENESLPTKWSKTIVKSLKGVVKRGIQFFVGHNSDNSTEGRKSIGEVVSNFQKTIGDKLHNIVIGYFPDKLEADKYNVCSIEGNILAQDYEDYSIVREIKNISGIALGNSAYEKPAFPGAVYLGAIQAFGDDGDDNNPPPKNITGGNPMTFEDVKKAIRDMNIHVSQLYEVEDIKSDRVFSKTFDEVANAAKEGMISKEDYEKEVGAKNDEIKKLVKDVSLVTAQDKLKNNLPEGLTDPQKTFIGKKFKPETMDDLSDDNIKKFVDNSLSEFSEYASIFGSDKTADVPNDEPSNDDNNLDEIDKIVDDVMKEPQGV